MSKSKVFGLVSKRDSMKDGGCDYQVAKRSVWFSKLVFQCKKTEKTRRF